MSKKQKALVTGAAGFIGSHLVERLSKTFDVRGLDNFSHQSEYNHTTKIYHADIRYYEQIEHHVKWADIIYHLAAQGHVDRSIEAPGETLDVNIWGTYNILEACRKYKKKIIYASTCEIYGAHEDLINEQTATNPQSPYAMSKLAADKLCENYFIVYGVEVVLLRNFNTYGPWQNKGSYGSAIPRFTEHILRGKKIPLYGDGSQKRDYMYIKDCMDGYMMVTETPSLVGKALNVGSGSSIKIIDLAKLIAKIANKPLKIKQLPARAGELKKLQGDITQASKLGYKPKYDLEKGLTEYINWFRSHYNL